MGKTILKFKVGQTVELISNNSMVASLGATAVVTRGNHDLFGYDCIKVVWKTNYNHQMNGGYWSSYFKPLLKEGQQLLFNFMIKQNA